ncbi:MAG: ParA family protein [Cyclobacteriaceae bacterium]
MIIAIVNQKGGTGKTTTTINLGRGLSESKKRVLLVDMDAQGSMGYSLGILQAKRSIAEVIQGEVAISDIIVSRENLDIAPSNVSLADLELAIADEPNRESILKGILDEVKNDYDHILIDCPPSLSLMTINALTCADKIIIPMQMEVLSLQGLDLISDTIEKTRQTSNPDLTVLGILPVMLDKRRKLSNEIMEHIRENYDFRIFSNYIRTNVRASEAPSFGQSVLTYASSSSSAQDYRSFTKELLKTIK